ncbi:urease accessory protein UreF [Halosaccharopolyspora lacisalsi]|nr:urease accessory UreF family protein [Halosaccharopolyspora lacisalsi]
MLALADARFPGGGHVHSGGLEEATHRGVVTRPEELREFLFGRLHGTGELAAVFAAAATHSAAGGAGRQYWLRFDAELDARTPSPAQRDASRAQGRGTARAGRVAWPSSALDELLAATARPHHATVLGVLLGGSGNGTPRDAAAVAAYLALSGSASAAVRLLGLDPFAANAAVTELGPELDRVAERAADTVGDDPADLPAPSAPALDLLAEAHQRHHREEVRLFAS